jgi:hypothetical protein
MTASGKRPLIVKGEDDRLAEGAEFIEAGEREQGGTPVDIDDVGGAEDFECRETFIAKRKGKPCIAQGGSVSVDPELADQLGLSGPDVRLTHRRGFDHERVARGLFPDQHPVINTREPEGFMLPKCGTSGSTESVVRAD